MANPGQLLFSRVLTITDAYGTNGLAISQLDTRHFPILHHENVPILLAVIDHFGKVWWPFEYICSRNQYYLRWAWHQFVKEHNLQPGDKVHFYRQQSGDLHIRFERVNSQAPRPRPRQAPGQVPIPAPGQVPTPAPGQVPGQAQGSEQAPGQVPTQAPGHAQVPGQAEEQAPEQAPGQVPTHAPGHAQVPGQEQQQAPGQAPGQVRAQNAALPPP